MRHQTAIIPGSFDPPHEGHLALAADALRGGMADKVVMAIVHNPTKKDRLISPENAAALLRESLPEDVRDRIEIAATGKSAPKIAAQFNATAVIRGRRDGVGLNKETVHEIVVASYFSAYRIVTGQRINVSWVSDLGQSRSSTKVRRVLMQDTPRREDLLELVSGKIADILLAAKSQCASPLSTPAGVAEFNSALKQTLQAPQPEVAAAAPRRPTLSVPTP